MRFYILVSCLFLLSPDLFSQKSIGSSFDTQYSNKARKLATRLTSKLDNDEDKVKAIHNWITHHIRYDVKKYLKNDFTHLGTGTILRTRKATCVGYSDLFTELCHHSDVACVNIPGYIKNKYVDIDDNFYLAEHMWNAVKINNTWKLTDICWDAGYVTNLKRTFRGSIKYLLTGGKRTIYKRKQRFKFHSGDFYYMRSGEFFRTDHLPLNPTWQLTQPHETIADFENDSSYYYGVYDASADSLLKDNDSHATTEYLFKSEKEKYIKDGFEGKRFNERNNFDIGNCYRIIAEDSLFSILRNPAEGADQVTRCNFVIECIDSAALYFSRNDTLLNLQEHDLIIKNDLKKDIFDSINGRLTSSTNKVIAATKLNKAFFKKSRKESFLSIKANKRRVEGFNKEKPISEMKSAKRTNENDSIMLAEQIKILSEIATGLYDSLKYFYKYLDVLYPDCKTQVFSHSGIKKDLLLKAQAISDQRVHFKDDLDFEIINMRDDFFINKMKCDSMLFSSDTSIFKFLEMKTSVAEDEVNHIYSIYHSLLIKLRKLKTRCAANDKIDFEYDRSVNELINILEEFQEREADWVNMCMELTPISRTIYRQAIKELKIYEQEKIIERQNSEERIFFIKNRKAGYQRLNKQARSASNSLKLKAGKIMKKVSR